MSRSSAGNWLERGAPPDEKVQQLLAHYLGVPEAADTTGNEWLAVAATEAIGMVLSDASELQVGSYLRRLAEERGRSGDELRGTRVFAIALWHMVKAAELRDRAKRAVRMANAQQQAMQGPLDEWLAERVLSPEERAAYRAERDRG